ncbi:MAG: ABC transporter ATP-binding protein [Granulosicoccus sp.]
MPENTLLQIEDLQVCLHSVTLLRQISLHIDSGEILGLVGESGSGKSLTALSIMGLLETPPMRTVSGRILFNHHSMLEADAAMLESIRGNEAGMIFQEPMTSLNPVFTIGDQVMEVLYLHTQMNRQAAMIEAKKLMQRVGLMPAELSLTRYPHQLSGGQRQRVMIAMAIACNPLLLIADEPTTALDVTVQAQILELLDQLRREHNMSMLLIAHDLGVVRHYCDRVAVMYCGQIVEQATSNKLFLQPRHPYTLALLKTIPAANPAGIELPSIPGSVPAPESLPSGCSFAPRCERATPQCHRDEPPLSGDVHRVRCWHPIEHTQFNVDSCNG